MLGNRLLPAAPLLAFSLPLFGSNKIHSDRVR
jgi:hypothetical protein